MIAERVDLSQPTFFQRFGDRTSLLAAALAAEPIDPERIVGKVDELARLGRAAHLEALALWLLKQVLEVAAVTEVAAGGRVLRAEAVRRTARRTRCRGPGDGPREASLRAWSRRSARNGIATADGARCSVHDDARGRSRTGRDRAHTVS